MKGRIKSGEATIPDLIQFHNGTNATGTIKFIDHVSDETGFITISNGQVINARYASFGDEQAIVELAKRQDLSFEFVREIFNENVSITKTTTSLLMDAALAIDQHAAFGKSQAHNVIDLSNRANHTEHEQFHSQEFDYLAHYGMLIADSLGYTKVRLSAYLENKYTTVFRKHGNEMLGVVRSKAPLHSLKSI